MRRRFAPSALVSVKCKRRVSARANDPAAGLTVDFVLRANQGVTALLGLIIATLSAGWPGSVHAQTVMDCRVTDRAGLFAGEAFTAASSFATDVSGGFLRLLLVRLNWSAAERAANPDSPSDYVVVFEPFSGHRSIHGTARSRDGGDAQAKFWMATSGPGEQVVIDRWDISSSVVSHSGLTLQCPSHK